MTRYYYTKKIIMCKITGEECQCPHHNVVPNCDRCEVAKSVKLLLESYNQINI